MTLLSCQSWQHVCEEHSYGENKVWQFREDKLFGLEFHFGLTLRLTLFQFIYRNTKPRTLLSSGVSAISPWHPPRGYGYKSLNKLTHESTDTPKYFRFQGNFDVY